MAKNTLAAILKEYDDYLGIGSEPKQPKHFHTGVIGLDYMLSDEGGIPGNSIVQILGESGHGKTTLSLDFLARAQENGLNSVQIKGREINAVVLDFERSYDPLYADVFGIDSSKVLVVRTNYAEESFMIAENLMLAGIQFILVDSIGMLVAQDEEDKTYVDRQKIAAEAQALSRFAKRINAFMDENSIMFVINHYRANLSPMAMTEKKAYGAHVLKYTNKVSLELRRISRKEDVDTIEVFVEKNKTGGRKGLKAQFQNVSTKGINYNQHILDLALEFGIVTKRGAWYYYPNYENAQYRAQGESNAANELPFEIITPAVKAFITEQETNV